MPINVILVEDDADIRMVIGQHLRFRFEVSDFGDARQALEFMKKRDVEFDMAVIDLWMPGMDGLALIEEIRADANFSELPVIIITGIVPDHKDLPDAFWTKNLGIAGFLHKPFHPQDLTNKIDEVIRQKRGLPPAEEETPPRGGFL